MTLETAMHRIDAELAVTSRSAPRAAELAVDGVDELPTMFLARETQQWTEQYADKLNGWVPRWLLVSTAPAGWRIVVRPHGVGVEAVPQQAAAGDEPAAHIHSNPDAFLHWAYNGGGQGVVTTGDARMFAQFKGLLTAVTSIS